MITSRHGLLRGLVPRWLLFAAGSALGLILWCACLEADVAVFDWTNSWHFEQTANLDGVAWQAPQFDDSGWRSGPGNFFVETNGSVPQLTTALTLGRSCYYFRTHFQLPIAPTNVVLLITNRVDDGAVYYLNGAEVYRQRMAAAPAAIQYSSLANQPYAYLDAVAYDVIILPGGKPTSLAMGDNVLAVELHPANLTNDDDVVFGAAVGFRFTSTAPIVVLEPQDLEVLDSRSVQLTAVLDGNPSPTRQWYKDGSPIASATKAALSIAKATVSDSGHYWMVASNRYGVTKSREAVLSVVPDGEPPKIVGAVASLSLTSITIDFSEPINPYGGKYIIEREGNPSETLRVLNVNRPLPTRALVVTSNRVPNVNYVLRVSDVVDMSAAANRIAPATAVPLGYEVSLVTNGLRGEWSYDPSGLGLVPGWTRPEFDDSAWPMGLPMFVGGGAIAGPTPAAARTVLASFLGDGKGAAVTYGFRVRFEPPGPLRANSIQMRTAVDDGVVAYLNGQEIYALGMPSHRPLGIVDVAERSVGAVTFEPAVNKPGIAFGDLPALGGENVLALELHQSASGLDDAALDVALWGIVERFWPQATLVVPPEAIEGGGVLAGAGQVCLADPVGTDTVVSLSSSDAALFVPGSVRIAAGATNATFDVRVAHDPSLTGPRRIALVGEIAGGGSCRTELVLLDKESVTVRVHAPESVTEGGDVAHGLVTFDRPVGRDVAVALRSELPAALAVPSYVMMPAGATSCVFEVSAPENPTIDGDRFLNLTAIIPGWPSDSAGCLVIDNEPSIVTLNVPTQVVEGSSSNTLSGTVGLGGITGSPVTVRLMASMPERLLVPAETVIPAGRSNVAFDVTVPDDVVWRGTAEVVITARVEGVGEARRAVTVVEDDPDHFEFTPIPNPQVAGAPFQLTIRAMGADGSAVTGFERVVELSVRSLSGSLGLDPSTVGPFISGEWSGAVAIAGPGRLVRLTVAAAMGESGPFHVERAPFARLTQAASDILWHSAGRTLLGLAPLGAGAYSNQVMAIDPGSGAVTNAYRLPFEAISIEGSPDGSHAYVVSADRNSLCRFDLGSRVAGSPFSVGADGSGKFAVADFAPLSGAEDAVAVRLTSPGGNYLGIWRFERGSGVYLDTFSPLDPNWIDAGATGGMLYGCLSYQNPTLIRGVARPGTALSSKSGVFRGGGLLHRNGVLYDPWGNAASASTLGFLGTYPSVDEHQVDPALVDVDVGLNRVFYFWGGFNYGSSFYRFRAYDRESFKLVGSVDAPQIQGYPVRFINLDGEALAFTTTGNQLWIVRSESLVPKQDNVSLRLSQSLAPFKALLGDSVTLTLTLTNAGTNLASFVRVTNAVPAGADVVGLETGYGSAFRSGGNVVWTMPRLDGHVGAALKLTLRLTQGGYFTNVASVTSYEPDSYPTATSSRGTWYAGLPTETPGVFRMVLGVESLVYSPSQDRLLLGLGSGNAGYENGLAVFNPHNGEIESFTALGSRPGRLALSSDGRLLHVSLPETARVVSLDLPGLAVRRSFSLGKEEINGAWYPFYAAELVALPGSPESVVVWRKRRAGSQASEYGQGIAVFDGVVMRPEVTAVGGAWSLGLGPVPGTVVACEPVWSSVDSNFRRVFHELGLSAGGVALFDGLPGLAFSAGEAFKSAGGRILLSGGFALGLSPFGISTVFEDADGSVCVEADEVNKRAFFLGARNGNWRVHVNDLETGAACGGVALPLLSGTPDGLVRWGSDGLAFRTTDRQLWVVRSGLVNPREEADLEVRLLGSGPVVSVGAPHEFQVTVTNRGPSDAQRVVVDVRGAPEWQVAAANATRGDWGAQAGGIQWTIDGLPVGTGASLLVRAVLPGPGAFTLSTSVRSDASDASEGNNFARRLLFVGAAWGTDNPVVTSFDARDMVWSEVLGRLLLTAEPGMGPWAGGLISLDPATMEFRFESHLGVGAGRLLLSRDGSILRAELAHGVARRKLPDMVAEPDVQLGGMGTLYSLLDFDNFGEEAESFVAGRSVGYLPELAVFDGDRMRPGVVPVQGTSWVARSSGSSPTVFVHNYSSGSFRRFGVDEGGVKEIDQLDGLIPGVGIFDLLWSDGLLYSAGGVIVDPQQRALLGSIPGVPADAALHIDASTGRLLFAGASGGKCQLLTADVRTRLPLEAQTLPGITGRVTRVTRWGGNLLAVLTEEHELLLVRSSMFPTGEASDMQFEVLAAPSVCDVGTNSTVLFVVRNLGPSAAADVSVGIGLSPTARLEEVRIGQGQGTAMVTNGFGNAFIPSLAKGGEIPVSIRFTPVQAGVLEVRGTVASTALDPDGGNNGIELRVPIRREVEADGMVVMALGKQGFAHDPVTDELYVAGPGRRVSVVRPDLGLLVRSFELPSEPALPVLSDSRRALYLAVGNRGSVARLWLPEGRYEALFSLGSASVAQLCPLPGSESSILVATESGSPALAVYDDATARPLMVSRAGASPSVVLGDVPQRAFVSRKLEGYIPRLSSLVLAAQGVSETRWDEGWDWTRGPLKFSGGRLFTGGGYVDDPDSLGVVGRFEGVEQGTLVEPDLSAGRVFFVGRRAMVPWLYACDTATRKLIGARSLPGVAGEPSNLVRWGADGLAFCTSSDQLVILRSGLIPAGGAADLVLNQSVGPDPCQVGTSMDFTVTVTNLGPNVVSNIIVLGGVGTNARPVTAAGTIGTATVETNGWRWLVGRLDRGQSARAVLTVEARLAGEITHVASVVSSNFDPDLANNTSRVSANAHFQLQSDTSGQIGLQVVAMRYDPVSGLLYATRMLPGDRTTVEIVAVDPATGHVGEPIFARAGLSRLAVSTDGSRLFVLGDGGRVFHRLSLPTGALDQTVMLGVDAAGVPLQALDLDAVPFQRDAVALVVAGDGALTAAVYDAASRRPETVAFPRKLEFVTPTLAFGYDDANHPYQPVLLELTPLGFSIRKTVDTAVDYYLGSGFVVDGGMVYASDGFEVDPISLTRVRNLPASGLLAAMSDIDRIAFLTRSGAELSLRVFGLRGGEEWAGVPTVAELGGGEAAGDFQHCGQDRLAFRTPAGQVVVVRSGSLPSGPAADIGFVGPAPRLDPVAGKPFDLVLTVTNKGPVPADLTRVFHGMPADSRVLTSETSQGSIKMVGNALEWTLGSLAPGATALIRLVVVCDQPGVFSRPRAVVSSAGQDPRPEDNFSDCVWTVGGGDATSAVEIYDLKVAGLAWDETSGFIYASVLGSTQGLGDCVISLDPVTGRFGQPIPVGRNPGKLALSSDGSMLYVAMEDDEAVARLRLASRSLEAPIPVGSGVKAAAIIALPNQTDTMMIGFAPRSAYTPWASPGVALYRDGIRLPETPLPGSSPATSLTLTGDGKEAFAYNGSAGWVWRVDVSAAGVSSRAGGVRIGYYEPAVDWARGLLYSTYGTVLDPGSMTVVTNFYPGVQGANGMVDPTTGRWSFLFALYGKWGFRQFDGKTYELLMQSGLPGVQGALGQKVRCAPDLMAFSTTSNQLVVLRLSKVVANLAVTVGKVPGRVRPMERFTVSFSVANVGETEARDLVVTNRVPEGVTVLDVDWPDGRFSRSGSSTVLRLDSLAPGASRQFTVNLMATNLTTWTGTYSLAASCAFPDPSITDNTCSVTLLNFIDFDSDGMPDDWEWAHGFGSSNPDDALADSDGDGLTNLQEYLADTDPRNPQSVLRVLSCSVRPGAVVLSFAAVPGKFYAIEGSAGLTSPNWSMLATNLAATASTVEVSVPGEPGTQARFFRARLLSGPGN